jgi:hypothetical protein
MPADLSPTGAAPGRWDWWNHRRLRLTVVVGTMYAIVAAVNEAVAVEHPFGDLAMGTLVYGILIACSLAVVNVVYTAFPLAEPLVSPDHVGWYRRAGFAVAVVGSLLVPWLILAAMFR